MTTPILTNTRNSLQVAKIFSYFLVLAMLVSACGGTDVYNNSKTIVYRGTIYNVTNVQQIASNMDLVLEDKTSIDLHSVDRDQFEAYVEQEGPVFVSMIFHLDDQDLVYGAQSVDNWRDLGRLQDRFEDAGKDIADLLADKKETQIELR
jgi:hypothetical protein